VDQDQDEDLNNFMKKTRIIRSKQIFQSREYKFMPTKCLKIVKSLEFSYQEHFDPLSPCINKVARNAQVVEKRHDFV
jgi:hypothetical protein